MLHWFARRIKEIHEKDKKGEKGFTLIELLVVVIIIGVLAAIAIPAFLAQRQKAETADAESTVRNAGAAQQAWLVDHNTYTTDKANLLTMGFNDSVKHPLTIVGADADSYCRSSGGGAATTMYLDSGPGTVSTTACTGAGTN
jgi:type IV pilus assembly protein PilA